jgi:ferredoxin-type protein NapG
MKRERRNFLLAFLAGMFAPLVLPLLAKLRKPGRHRHLRPPGARPEAEFLDACIGCGQCANVCPNKCITLQGLDDGIANFATPVISARARGCVLCMACTQVCPTGALQPLEPEEKDQVDMGTAVVLEDLCYSFAGRICGVCYRACPIPGKALKLGLFEQPHIDPDYCVGCGLCEQACVHMPQAIRVIPRSDRDS